MRTREFLAVDLTDLVGLVNRIATLIQSIQDQMDPSLGFQIPRMGSAARDLLIHRGGMIIYNTDINAIEYYDEGVGDWVTL